VQYRDPAQLQPGEWTRINRKLFELAMEARLSEAEGKAREATGHVLDSVQGLDLKLVRFSKELRLLPREVFLGCFLVGSSRVDLQACKLEYSIVSPK